MGLFGRCLFSKIEIWRQALDNYPSNWGSILNDFISYNNGSDMIIYKKQLKAIFVFSYIVVSLVC